LGTADLGIEPPLHHARSARAGSQVDITSWGIGLRPPPIETSSQ
jgi:hypothetical protein